MTPPCKNCEDRHHGCHSTCEEYLEYSKEREEIRKQRVLDNQANRDFYESRPYKQRMRRKQR